MAGILTLLVLNSSLMLERELSPALAQLLIVDGDIRGPEL